MLVSLLPYIISSALVPVYVILVIFLLTAYKQWRGEDDPDAPFTP